MLNLSSVCFLYLIHTVVSLPVTVESLSVPLPHIVVSTDQRSIFHIVWSCVATLFACAWVAVHPDLPGLDTGGIGHFFHRFKLMLWVLISPEAVLVWAWRQNRGAQALNTLIHSKIEGKAKGFIDRKWSLTRSHFLQMGGFMLVDGPEDKPQGLLNYAQFIELLEAERTRFPTIKSGHIQDRSKSDGLSKFIAVGQALWFIIQCIARTVAGLPITLIELATAAFAPISVIMYILWWDKPQNVQSYVDVRLLPSTTPITSTQPTTATSPNTATSPTAKGERLWIKSFFNFLGFPFTEVVETFENMLGTTRRSQNIENGARRVPRFYAYPANSNPDKIQRRPVILGSVLGSIFGAVHCIGWAFTFPSSIEKTIWRVTSASIVAIPLSAIGLIFTARKCLHRKKANRFVVILLKIIFGLIAVFLAFAYIISRLALLVVMFTVLRDLPQNQLKDIQWIADIPHI